MRFLTITLIVHSPDPVTGAQPPTTERFRAVIESALLAEELGFDGFGVGERHERPFISSSPPVMLSHIAALTSRIRLFTAVTTLSLLDPVRAYEDYATLDHLSGGRLELIIGKGNGAAQRELFHVTPEDQWDRNAESYEIFRAIWRQDKVTASPRFRPELRDAEVWPRPLQQPSAYRPAFEKQLALQQRMGLPPVFPTLEDFVARSSALIGSPQQIIEKVHRYHDQFGHTVMHLHAEAGWLSAAQHRQALELFQSDIAPVLRREIPDPPWPWAPAGQPIPAAAG
jgi:alkanesulfonate monooxygenase SsuD/methylene tetrahydromethanopterin reductase-like flavin-dependent oxidoreductase (luciferase family)